MKNEKENETAKNYIRDNYYYNPITGDLWKKYNKFSRVCNSIHDTGCYQVNILNKVYKAHRVCWLLYYGEFPEDQIDHIDMNRTNNKLDNLREANKQQNMCNRGKQKNNTSGFKGVTFCHRTDKWIAKIQCKSKNYYLGLYDTPERASSAYEKKADELFGEFNYQKV